ncbi:MAG: helix-turn-helix domain-containing GNAT family N-acetyltransferase [Pseudomonadota bacterium]
MQLYDPAFNSVVGRVRSGSRLIVRELGFMGQTLAETDLHASAVHAIIEIGADKQLTAKHLADILLLQKSTISRLLKGLKARGLIDEVRSESDGRVKRLRLTAKGSQTLEAIAAHATLRVSEALACLDTSQRDGVAGALEAYANALRLCRSGEGPSARKSDIRLEAGYAPGLVGEIVRLHGTYYARETGFDVAFEARVAEGLAEFAPRLGTGVNQIWHARREGVFMGSVAIDGEDLGGSVAHLRWFIVADAVRGTGTGRVMLAEALAFCDRQAFKETHLWTFKGLDAARHLYEASGFALVEEYWGDQWGKKVREQRFVRPLGGGQ